MAKDPVCNNDIDLDDIRYQSQFNGDIYRFDSPECKDLFDADPERYIAAAREKGPGRKAARRHAQGGKKKAA